MSLGAMLGIAFSLVPCSSRSASISICDGTKFSEVATDRSSRSRQLKGIECLFEAVGDDKVRVNCASWEDAKVILADGALQVVALGKILHVTRFDRPAEYLNVELNGLAEAGCGPVTKLRGRCHSAMRGVTS